MYPIYKFELTAGLATFQAFPVHRDLSLDWEKQSGQEFFRARLNGALTFEGADYEAILGAAFDTRFLLEIFISQDAGLSWAPYWRGTFWKTDCEFDGDAETVTVKPAVEDRYTAILAGMEREYDLIALAPEIVQIKADKRPLIQVYVPGDTVVGCFLAGMWWEQECEAVTDAGALRNTYHFYPNIAYVSITLSGTATPDVTGTYAGSIPVGWAPTSGFELHSGTGYVLRYRYDAPGGNVQQWLEVVRDSDGAVLFSLYGTGDLNPLADGLRLYAQTETGATGSVVTGSTAMTDIYARMISDTDVQGATTYDIVPETDIVPDNRNYRKVTPYSDPEAFAVSARMSAQPTEWGLYQPGRYYLPPDDTPDTWAPLSRSRWGSWSLWMDLTRYDWSTEARGRAPFTLRHCYPLSSVLSVLLGEVAPGVTHAGTVDYSQFLYGENLLGIEQTLALTPKSNVVTAGYDQPAQKAPVTLKNVLDMLRDCFRCYWYIDDDNRLRVEHVLFFMQGGSYDAVPAVGVDLTAMQNTRNGKPWSFARSQWKYEKPDMTGRYQFGWMDDCTLPFEGWPIDIVSGYVDAEKIENVDVSRFTSDIDYILLMPSEVSRDGFVLLAAQTIGGQLQLPYVQRPVGNVLYVLQNGYAAFTWLQKYYAYDMPAYSYRINGVPMTAQGIKRLKTQTVTFPARTDPSLIRLVKTGIGAGAIGKITINLSSRTANATLYYDTEQ